MMLMLYTPNNVITVSTTAHAQLPVMHKRQTATLMQSYEAAATMAQLAIVLHSAFEVKNTYALTRAGSHPAAST